MVTCLAHILQGRSLTREACDLLRVQLHHLADERKEGLAQLWECQQGLAHVGDEHQQPR